MQSASRSCDFVLITLPLGLIAASCSGVACILARRPSVFLLTAPRQGILLPIVVAPLQIEVGNAAGFTLVRLRHSSTESKGIVDDALLRNRIVRRPGGMAERQVDKDRTGRIGGFSDAAS